MAKTFKEWLGATRHLPSALRDFHQQKKVFKAVQRVAMRGTKDKPGLPSELSGINWIAAHIYVVDFFLVFMAAHGYTLQRTREQEGFKFKDLAETLQELEAEEVAALKKFFAEAAEAEKKEASEAGRAEDGR